MNNEFPGAYKVANDTISPLCNHRATHHRHRQISQVSLLYYALAICMKSQGNPKWLEYARKAVRIFQFTTKMDGHNVQHDQALEVLNKLLTHDRL